MQARFADVRMQGATIVQSVLQTCSDTLGSPCVARGDACGGSARAAAGTPIALHRG